MSRGPGVVAVTAAIVAGLACSTPALAQDSCPAGQIRTVSGCTPFAQAAEALQGIIEQTALENDVRAALVRIDVGDRRLATITPGESMAGVPANPRMHFRLGSIAIPYETTVMLQLLDEGKLSLDDPLSNWFPDLPNASLITLRMLAQSTSGYPDWIQENPAFIAALFEDPFRQWTTQELLEIALNRPLVCDPTACRHYAHTNFILLGKVIQEITGEPLATTLNKRVFRPLGMRQLQISNLPDMPLPVLHAYVGYRGFYEDSTFWSPSWTIAKNLIMTGTVGDVIKSAKALGTGALISAEAYREFLAPTTANAGYPGFSQDFYYGLGIDVVNTWQMQTPQLNGYNAVQGYLPSRKIAMAVVATDGLSAASVNSDNSRHLTTAITDYLTPNRPAVLPQ